MIKIFVMMKTFKMKISSCSDPHYEVPVMQGKSAGMREQVMWEKSNEIMHASQKPAPPLG